MKSQHSKASLFLMELIVSLLFFSLASTVCIRLFVNAYTLGNQTQDINYAVTQAQNLAECFISYDGNLSEVQPLFANSVLSNDGTSLSVKEGDYHATLFLTYGQEQRAPSNPGLVSAEIMIYSGNETDAVYTLHIDHHIAERRRNHE